MVLKLPSAAFTDAKVLPSPFIDEVNRIIWDVFEEFTFVIDVNLKLESICLNVILLMVNG